jgi:uncharacterized membrane protein
MENSKQSLYYISSICWQETNKEEIINVNALQKNEYIEVPKGLSEEETAKFIDHKLFESSSVYPWYYITDMVC